jgi:serine/threonine protein kinase
MRQAGEKTLNASGDSPRPLLPHYRREREIGRGEYGVVYLAKYLGTHYALKVVRHPDNADASRADAYARELRGVRLVMGLPKIDGLVRIHDFAQRSDGSEFAYVMDLADPEREEIGPFDDNYRPRTLASVIDAEVALPLDECLDIGIRIASVLVALQRRHIIHRDIKPGNIIFVRGKAVLADVGLAIDARDAASIVGTPGYAPPERQGSPAGDVFGLGKTLYRISTGRQPSEEGLPPCTEADIDSPYFWKWMTILSKATSRDPARRYRSAKGLLRDLWRLRAKVSRTRRFIRRLMIVVCVALALTVVAPALWNLNSFRNIISAGEFYVDRLPFPYPYNFVRNLIVSANAPPYPYDIDDPEVVRIFQNESLGECDLIDWSDWSDKEFETKSMRAHLLLPMRGFKQSDWNQPKTFVLYGSSHGPVKKPENQEPKTGN